jgi:hypothetical protein
MHADRPAVSAATRIQRLRTIDRLGDGVGRRVAYAECTEFLMRTPATCALTLLTLVGAALCALWLAAVEPSIVDPLPIPAAAGR